MKEKSIQLKRIELTGFKSIKNMDLELGPINVLIGANGAGKSNLLKFFTLIRAIRQKKLSDYVIKSGGAAAILCGGPKQTNKIEFKLLFELLNEDMEYSSSAEYTPPDSLYSGAFHYRSYKRNEDNSPEITRKTPKGDKTSQIQSKNKNGDEVEQIQKFGECLKIYHFADTTPTAAIRGSCYLHDNKSLHADGKNLAAILYRIFRQDKICYSRILGTIRQICPWFGDFVNEPMVDNLKNILLDWREANSEEVFGAHILPDGAIRAIALITLLLQPWEDLPPFLIIDEPELGLHPHALIVIGALLNQASYHCQLIVGTQSTLLLDQFEPKDVVVVEREEGASTFKRLKEENLRDWLSEYSLSELWEKNVIGGGPF
jgi:predicted ATPase